MIQKNPNLKDDSIKVTMTAGALKKILKQAFELGWERSSKANKTIADLLGGRFPY